uniref:Uncharacterized protein n=1 Tax=Graphocephala atropunctata TaxID=36148 RepID=A0A1B6LEA4_9HEMI
MGTLTPVTHIIFDLDGLLIDSETLYRKSYTALLEKYGKVYTEEIRFKVMGSTEQDFCRILVEELKLPMSAEEFEKVSTDWVLKDLKDVELKPGAERLVRYFHKNSVPMAVATSSGRATCEVKMERYPELTSCFNHVVMGSSDNEVVNGKPAPDIFFVAAKRFSDNPSPNKCLVFEDSYNGVLAAKAAGMQVVMVPDALVSQEKQKEATIVYKSLEDFVPEIFGLPPFDST